MLFLGCVECYVIEVKSNKCQGLIRKHPLIKRNTEGKFSEVCNHFRKIEKAAIFKVYVNYKHECEKNLTFNEPMTLARIFILVSN